MAVLRFAQTPCLSSITYRNRLGSLAPQPRNLAAVAAAERDMLGTRQVVPS